MLEGAKPRVVLVDYFGTVVTRTVPPWYVKLLAGRRLVEQLDLDVDPIDLYRTRIEVERRLCNRALEQGLDADFRLDDLADELAEVVARSGRGSRTAEYSTEGLATLMIDAEVESDLLVQRVDVALVKALRQRPNGAELVLVSDFYIPQPHFGRFLEHHGLTDLFGDVFVSCEHGRTKKSGALFELVAKRVGVDPQDVLVVGDNPISDGRRAREAGMRSHLVTQGTWERRKDAGADEVARDVERQLDGLLRPADEADLFPAMGLTLYTFVRRLHRRLRAEGAREALFLAREGQFLSRLLAAYEEETALPGSMRITQSYLMVSRRATYLPSLPPLPHEEFEAVRERRPGLTVGEFLETLGFDAASLERLATAMTGDPAGSTSLDLDAVLAHAAFAEEYEQRRVEQREALLEYLDKSVDWSARPVVHLVDVGWKGTTQDRLARVLVPGSRVALRGHYLGLLVAAPPEALESKQGILFHNWPWRSAHLEVFAHFKTIFEALLSADHGSVRGYEWRDEGAVPVLEDIPEERAAYEQYVAPVQHRIERRFRLLCRELARSPLDDEELVDLAAGYHARMLFRPSTAEIRFFEQLPVYDAGRRRRGYRPKTGPSSALGIVGQLFAPRRLVTGGGWPPIRMRAAGVGWLRYPYGWYKVGVQRTRARKARPVPSS